MAVHKYVRSRDGRTVYCACYGGPDGFRVKEKVKTVAKGADPQKHVDAEAAARMRAMEQRAAVENGTWKDPRAKKRKRLTFEGLVKDFLEQYRTRADKGMSYYEFRLKPAKEFFKKKPAELITASDVESYRRHREAVRIGKPKTKRGGKEQEEAPSPARPLSPSTIRKDVVVLSTLFRWAKAHGLASVNPADPDVVKRPAEPRSSKRSLSPDDESALLALLSLPLQRVVRFAIGTGMDRGEVLALSWHQVDERTGKIQAPRAKTGVPRTIHLNETLKSILEDCRKLRGIGSEASVFLDEAGKPFVMEAVKTTLRRAYKDAGLVGFSGPFKTFRHTFATRLAAVGTTAPELARLLGHTTSAVLDTYVHLFDSHMKDVMARLDPASPPPPPCDPKSDPEPAPSTAQSRNGSSAGSEAAALTA